MGTAIVLKNADFSEKNLGKVTFYKPEKLESLTITGPDIIENTIMLAKYNVEYNPKNTDQLEVKWEITNNTDLATINSNGELILNDNNTNGIIVIKVSSLNNPSISATKTIEVNRDVYNLTEHLTWHENAYWDSGSPYFYSKETTPDKANVKSFCTFDFVNRDLGNFVIKIKEGWLLRPIVANEAHPLNGGIGKSLYHRSNMVISSDDVLYSFSRDFSYSSWTFNISRQDQTAITLEDAKQAITFMLVK